MTYTNEPSPQQRDKSHRGDDKRRANNQPRAGPRGHRAHQRGVLAFERGDIAAVPGQPGLELDDSGLRRGKIAPIVLVHAAPPASGCEGEVVDVMEGPIVAHSAIDGASALSDPERRR